MTGAITFPSDVQLGRLVRGSYVTDVARKPNIAYNQNIPPPFALPSPPLT